MDGSGYGPGNLDWHGNGAGTVQQYTDLRVERVLGNRSVEASELRTTLTENTSLNSRANIMATITLFSSFAHSRVKTQMAPGQTRPDGPPPLQKNSFPQIKVYIFFVLKTKRIFQINFTFILTIRFLAVSNI